MSIQIECHCGKSLNVADDLAGKRIRCPACKNAVSIPARVAAAELEPETVPPDYHQEQHATFPDESEPVKSRSRWLGLVAVLVVLLVTGSLFAGVYFLDPFHWVSADKPAAPPTSKGPTVVETKMLKPRSSIDCKSGGESEIERVSIDSFGIKAAVYVRGKDVESNFQVWDLTKGARLDGKNNKNAASVVAITPDGNRTAYLSADGAMLLVGLQKGKKGGGGGQLPRVEEAKSINPLTNAYFFNVGESLVLGTRRGVFVWDMMTRQVRFKCLAPNDNPILTISRPFYDSYRIAFACENGSIQICTLWTQTDKNGKWEVKDGSVLFSLTPPNPKKVVSIALSPDCKKLAAGEEDGQITVWDVEKKAVAYTIPSQDSKTAVPTMLFLKDSKTLAYPNRENQIVLHHLESGTKRAILEGHGKEVLALDVTADNSTLISGDRAGTLIVWDLRSVP